MSTSGIALAAHHATASSSSHRAHPPPRTRKSKSASAQRSDVRARDHARHGAPRIPHYGSTTTSLSASTPPVLDDTDTDSGSVTTGGGGGSSTPLGEKVAVGGYGYRWLYNTGDEPGVDVRKAPGVYAKLRDPARCTIVDYDDRGQGTRVDVPGAKLREWLESEDGRRPSDEDDPREEGERQNSLEGAAATPPARQQSTGGSPHPQQQPPSGSSRRSVRWINVDGINFDIVKTLALRYDLHPLAIEDALRAGNNPRSKVDFYATHLYAQVFVQYQQDGDEEAIQREAAAMDAAASRPHLHPRPELGGGGGSWRKWLGLDHGPQLQSLPEGVEGVFEPIQTVQTRRGRMVSPAREPRTCDFAPTVFAACCFSRSRRTRTAW